MRRYAKSFSELFKRLDANTSREGMAWEGNILLLAQEVVEDIGHFMLLVVDDDGMVMIVVLTIARKAHPSSVSSRFSEY
jgi:hypothetical protein